MSDNYWRVVRAVCVCVLWAECADPAGLTCRGGQIAEDGGCADKGECLASPCGSNAKCKSTGHGFSCVCNTGFYLQTERAVPHKPDTCIDYNECKNYGSTCGNHSTCYNTEGSFYCVCDEGFAASDTQTTFTGYGKGCGDVDECLSNPCGPNAVCNNSEGSYGCTCNPGFVSAAGRDHSDICVAPTEFECLPMEIPECTAPSAETGTSPDSVTSATSDSAYCSVIASFEEKDPCRKLRAGQSFDFDQNLKNVTAFANQLLADRSLLDSVGRRERMNLFVMSLRTVENSVSAAASNLSHLEKKTVSFDNIEVEMQTVRRNNLTEGTRTTLSANGNQLDLDWRAVAADNDTGMVGVAFIAYSLLNGSFWAGEGAGEGALGSDEGLKLISDVVTTTWTKGNPGPLVEPINITFRTGKADEGGARTVCVGLNRTVNDWSAEGCSLVQKNSTHTTCSCNYLSSFAVLMALHEIRDPWHLFNLTLMSYIGLSISMVCLLVSIVTFTFCRAIKGTRNTIHIHLCLNLLLAELLFSVGISRTGNKLACALIAGFLHYFFLAVFAWMLLEGVQLYIMVVKVFNVNLLTKRHLLPVGYGMPLVIVGISAAVYGEGYGTERYCWLTLKKDFLWSFLGPVCAITVVNLMFYAVTVCQLARKMPSVQREKPKLKKLRLFTVTAIAQLCLLGCTWILGIFHFHKDTIAMAYIFTAVNSLQGAFIFVLHCLLNKQIREEYRKWCLTVCGARGARSEATTSFMPLFSLQEKSSFSTVPGF